MNAINIGKVRYCGSLIACFVLAACGGAGDTSGSNSSNSSLIGYQAGIFIDAPVAGIKYKTESTSGQTGSGGEFSFKQGEHVTFSIGNIELPAVMANSTVTPMDLAGTTDPNNAILKNILVLLQSLDKDGNPKNGIDIPTTAHAAAIVPLNLNTDASSFAANISTLVAQSGSANKAPIKEADAVSNFHDTLKTINVAPLADPGVDAETKTGLGVSLDGSKSADPNSGDSITYSWTLASQPSGSQATLNIDNTAKPILVPDVEGAYQLNLVVSDGRLRSTIKSVVIRASNVVISGAAVGAVVTAKGSSVSNEVTTVGGFFGLQAKNKDEVTLEITKQGHTCTFGGNPTPYKFTVGAADLNTDVTCSPNTYTISGSTDGATIAASGSSVGNEVTVDGGNFSLKAKFGNVITLTATKPGHVCVVLNLPVVVAADNKSDVNVICSVRFNTISGTTSGAFVSAAGTSGDYLVFNTPTTYTIHARYGEQVTLIASKSGFTCSVPGSPFNLVEKVNEANVSCTENNLTISGSVIGTKESVTLQLRNITQGTTYQVSASGAYSLTDISSSEEGVNTIVSDINNNGQVTGYTWTLESRDGSARAFIYGNGSLSYIGTLGGFSQGIGINDAGQVVGRSYTTGGETHAFIFANGMISDLGTLGGHESEARAINASGQIIGWSYTNGGDRHAFLYANGMMSDLGTLGGRNSFANAINTHGDITGWATTADEYQHPFVYKNGVMTQLCNNTWLSGAGHSINDAGHVAGQSIATDFEIHPFIDCSDIGSLGGAFVSKRIISLTSLEFGGPGLSGASSINSSGQVVGDSYDAYGKKHAFIFTNGLKWDLNNLVSTESLAGFYLGNSPSRYPSAPEINDAGTIVVHGYSSEKNINHAFILQPPTPFVFPALGRDSQWEVTVLAEPAGQRCSVRNGSGTITQNVTNLRVVCVPRTYTISGTTDGATITAIGSSASNEINISGNLFGLSDIYSLPANSGDIVTLTASKSGQVCTVAGSPITVSATNVTTASVTCTAGYTIGGGVSGLGDGKTLVLSNNSASNETVLANTPFSFSATVSDVYNVSVVSQPEGQTCSVFNASGQAVGNITDVLIECVDNTYTIGGTVSGLTISGLELGLSTTGTPITQTFSPTGNGTWNFAVAYPTGTIYSVIISTQPEGLNCSIINGSSQTGTGGVVSTTNATNINVSCINTFNISVFNADTPFGSGQASYLTLSLTTNGVTGPSYTVVSGGARSNIDFGIPAAWAPQLPVQIYSLVAHDGRLYEVSYKGTIPCTVGNTAPTGAVLGVAETISSTEQPVGGCTQDVYLAYVGPYAGVTEPTYTPFTFESGTTYSVSIIQQPSHATCMLTGGFANVITDTNASLRLDCAYHETQISGAIVGHFVGLGTGASGATLLLKVNDVLVNTKTLTNYASTFAFSGWYPAGATYSIEVQSQPQTASSGLNIPNNRFCKLYNGSGTLLFDMPVTNVILTCRSDLVPNAATATANKLGLFVANTQGNSITAFSADATGVLTKTADITHEGNINTNSELYKPSAIAVSNIHGSMFALSFNGNKMYPFSVGKRGTDQSVVSFAGTAAGFTTPILSVATDAGPFDLSFNPVAYQVAVTANTAGTIKIYNASGGNSSNNVSITSSNYIGSVPAARGVAYHPSGRYLYVVSANGSLYVFNSGLSPLYTSGTGSNLVPTGADPYYVTVEPSGNYVYVTNGSGSISQYKVCQLNNPVCTAGTLKPIGLPLPVSSPRQISADDKYVYLLSTTAVLSKFKISGDGTLMPLVTGGTVATDANPCGFVISPVFGTPASTPFDYSGITSKIWVTDSVLGTVAGYTNNPLNKEIYDSAGVGACSLAVYQ